MKFSKIIYLVILMCFFSFGNMSFASSSTIQLMEKKWSFDGIRGVFDRNAVARGYQVYREVCSACHSMNGLAYRNLTEIGISEQDAENIAAGYNVNDGPNDDGEMFDRPARLSDRFVSPFPNEKAARAANNGAYPVDLTLIIKARPNGADYVYSLLNGYTDPPEGVTVPDGMHYNKYFSGHMIAMTQPLVDGMVSYSDGVESSLEQMSADVVNFLQWAAEPEMEDRKRMGIKVMVYMAFFTLFFYLSKRYIWSDVEK